MLDTRRTGKDREMSCAIYRRHHNYHLSHKGCAIYLAVPIGSTILIMFHTRVVPSTGLLSCSVLLLVHASARKGKGEGRGKGRIEKGEVNEGKKRTRRGYGKDRKAKVRKGKQTKEQYCKNKYCRWKD